MLKFKITNEILSESFFENYRNILYLIKKELEKLFLNNQLLEKNNTISFSKKLFGELILVYYLQKKGFSFEKIKSLNLEINTFIEEDNINNIIDTNINIDLLDKIFEKLNGVTDENYIEWEKNINSDQKNIEKKINKKYGVYYTPVEIVKYMCQESIINYLLNELKEKVSKEEIESFIKTKNTLQSNIINNIELIDNLLKNITVCDPAVGSGAFLIGMINEISYLRNILSNNIENKTNRTLYDFKLQAIKHSLYGVDIDLGAIEITRLRLLLSLTSEEDSTHDIRPLPNLDYKIIQGDSLIGIEDKNLNSDILRELEDLKIRYFETKDRDDKFILKEKIQELFRKITKDSINFDFEVYFSEIFQGKKGFDVVIANPPYVSYGLRGGQKMTASEKETLRNAFPNSAEYKISLYALFMDKAIQIAKTNGGIQTYIVPDSFLLGRYFSKIRKYILRLNEIQHILLLPYGVFNATVGFSVIYLFQRKQEINKQHNITARFAEDNDIIQKGTYLTFSYPQVYFNNLKHFKFRLFFDNRIISLISKIEKNTTELGQFMTGRTGVRALIGQKNIISKKKKSKTWQRGLISGGQIIKYKISYDNDYINIDPKLLNKGGWDFDVINNPKLLLRQTGDSLTAAIDCDGLYHLNNIHSFALNTNELDMLYIMALINSKMFDFYYKTISLEANRVMAQTDIETLEMLPIKRITVEEQQPFIKIVTKIISITKSEDYLTSKVRQVEIQEYERQIDQMVYKLYELTKEEIEIVENYKKVN